MEYIKEYNEYLNDNFWKWFGDSKVIDNDGNPLVVYHGTDSNFDYFKNKELGYHFGTVYSAIDRINNKFKSLVNTSIIPVYLKIEKPLYMDDILIWDDVDEIVSELINMGILQKNNQFSKRYDEMLKKSSDTKVFNNINNSIIEDIIKFLKVKYDGIIYDNKSEDGGSASYLIFDNTNVKSAIGNNGNFDPNNPNINESF